MDVSSLSQFEKTKFFLDNPKAVKQKDTAKGAVVVSKNKKAQDMGSSSAKSSSESKKTFRLPTDEEYEAYKKTQPNKPTYGAAKKAPSSYNDFYNLKAQLAEPVQDKNISYDEKANKQFVKGLEEKNPRYFGIKKLKPEEVESDVNIQNAISSGYLTQDDLVKAGIKQSDEVISSLTPTSQKELDDAVKKVNRFRTKNPNEIESFLNVQKLDNPYMYEDYDEGDDFASTLFDTNELASRNINLNDFNGFLTEKGYKDDLKRFKELGLDKSSFGQPYDPALSLEKKKIQYLNMYINDQIQRDIKKQKFEYEKNTGVDPDLSGIKFKPSKWAANIDLTNYQELLKKEAPNLTAKMLEVDEKNLKNYETLVKSKGNVGAGKFLGEVLENGWNGLTNAISDFSASVYDILPGDYTEGIAESIREKKSIEEILKGDNFRYVTAEGYKTSMDGVEYISGSNGQVYDLTNKINVTNILPEEKRVTISEKARREGVRDKSISGLGTAYQGANVVGDLLFQLALTRGTGNGMKAVGGFTEGLGVLGKTKGFLKSVPVKRSVADATIAQSTLGFSKGYENTLKIAREAGIRDSEAKELASLASIETGAWYAMTAWINPQSKTTDLLFGKPKNEVIETAINAYVSNGKNGFLNTLRGFGKEFLNISGEGMAEVFQENIQQAGETFVINKDINELAGQELLKDTMSMQDFMDTSILSFVAGSLIPGAGAAVTQVNRTTRDILGMTGVDRFNALNTLAIERSKVSDLLSKQVVEGLYTQEQVDNILGEIDAYSSSINKMPQDISAEAAEDILEDVTTLSKLEQSKKEIDKSFHAPIDEQIDDVRSRIERRYYDDITSKRTENIKKAIQSGKVGDIEYREFEDEQNLIDTLVSEFNYDKRSAEQMVQNPGFILTEDNLKRQLPDDKFIPGKKIIFMNNSLASEGSQFSVGKHEFLHGIIYETIKGDREAQILLGKSLANEILNIQQDIIEGNREGVAAPKGFLRRFNQYVTKYSKLIDNQKILLNRGAISEEQYNKNVDTYLGNQWEEVLTLYSDAIDNGTVVFDDDIFTKIGDTIRRVLQRLGVKNVNFNSGKDVYNFIKDYNRSIEKGTFGGSLSKLATTKATVNKAALREEVDKNKKQPQQKPKQTQTQSDKADKEFVTDEKFSLKGDRIDPEKFKKEINSYYEKDRWGSEKDYVDSVIYDILNKYEVTIIQKAKGYGYAYLPDYSEMDMVAETQLALIPVVRNFNKEFFELRNEYKEKLKSRGLKEGGKEFKDELESQDEKGYKGKKGTVKENTDLNAYINSLLKFKMMDALKTGSVTSKQYNEDIDSEFFKETNLEGFDYQESEDMLDDIDSLLEEQLDFEQEQSKLAVLLKDPVFGFTDEDGNPIDIETVPFGAMYAEDINDPIIPANKKLKKATYPEEIKLLKDQLKKLERGLELQSKKELTAEEKEELKTLKSFKSYDLSTGGMVNTFEALSTLDKPAKIISDEIAREILRAPNLETLEYRNFKDKLSLTAQTMARRMTFKNSASLNKFMYDNWELIYDVINNPVDPVSGESSYASKKLPPRLKQLDDDGNFTKRKDVNRTTFLQSYFGDEETISILNTYSKNPEVEIKKLEETEVNEKTGNKLWSTAYFDRRTALMELFGDVLVLQEARRLLRDDSFLRSIADRNVNLYNDLKDDIKRDAILNNMAKGKSDIVKFNLAEKRNSDNSIYMSDFTIGDQVFISETIDNAVTNARNISEKAITFKVPNLKGMNDKARSFMLIEKASLGYNDFEFLNEEDAKGKLTEQVLNATDIKYTLASENAQYNTNLETAMNEIIEENKGVSVNAKYSPETAKNLGKNIGKYEIFVPAADDDFVGLVYRLATAKGKKGEAQLEFFNKNLIQPYSDAMLNLTHARQAMYADWTDLINKKYKNISKKLKQDSGYGNYTLDQAVRVYLWKQAGYEVPGLDAKDLISLTNIVRQDKELRDFATDISYMSKQANGYVEPDHNWGYGSVVGDINNVISKSNRKKFLEHWQHNVDKIFSKDNLSKIEALYGREYVSALKNVLDRMKLGTNRLDNSSDGFVNWLNGATGITMFLNMRSAVLQTLAAANFINTGDNNVIKATAAMANQPQFWKDFNTLWNSDYLKDRRSGLMNDVAEAELAQMLNDSRNKNVLDKVKAFNYWVLKQGFAPTRIADSFAIAFGGATFYRNRIKTYLKEGYSEEEASKMTMRDFYETAEASQQSADTSKISKNQASLKGRLIFAFQNTPLQYSRLMKRSWADIVKGRGSFANNIAKIVYYGAVQNLMFNFMQNALFSLLWDDEDEQKEAGLNQATIRTLNGSFDGILRGSGFKGAIISTIKNIIVKWYDVHGDPKAGGEIVVEALNISPPIGIKARKMMKAYKALEYNADEIKDKGFSIDNTYALEALTTITAASLNTPTDRLYQKAVNVDDAIRGDFETMERVALLLGYSKWNLGKGESTNPKMKNNNMLQDIELNDAELEDTELEIEE